MEQCQRQFNRQSTVAHLPQWLFVIRVHHIDIRHILWSAVDIVIAATVSLLPSRPVLHYFSHFVVVSLSFVTAFGRLFLLFFCALCRLARSIHCESHFDVRLINRVNSILASWCLNILCRFECTPFNRPTRERHRKQLTVFTEIQFDMSGKDGEERNNQQSEMTTRRQRPEFSRSFFSCNILSSLRRYRFDKVTERWQWRRKEGMKKCYKTRTIYFNCRFNCSIAIIAP